MADASVKIIDKRIVVTAFGAELLAPLIAIGTKARDETVAARNAVQPIITDLALPNSKLISIATDLQGANTIGTVAANMAAILAVPAQVTAAQTARAGAELALAGSVDARDIAQAAVGVDYPDAAAALAGSAEGARFTYWNGDAIVFAKKSAGAIVALTGPWFDRDKVGDKTVAQLLASTLPARGTGAQWNAGGFRYIEAAPSATDYHLITAGGAKLYVQPDATGYSFEAFGAVGDGVTDNLAIWNRAKTIAGLTSGRTLNVGPGDFYFSNTVVLPAPMRLIGVGSAIAAVPVSTYRSPTRFLVPAGVNGLDTGGGAYSIIENIAIVAKGKSTIAHGVQFTRRAQLRYVVAQGFSGDGFSIFTTGGGNDNLWRMEYCHADDCDGNGLLVRGGNSNAGTNIGFNATFCGQWGIRDSSFLGNHHYGCHTANCGGAYMADNSNSAGTFIGCYSENKQWNVSVATVLGGSNSFTNLSGAAPLGTSIYAFPNTVQVGRINVSAGGSGYTAPPTVSIDAPTGAAAATADCVLGTDGSVEYVRVLTSGAGYSTPPIVTFTGGGGSGATATAYIGKPLYTNGWGIVWMIAINSKGSGYTSAPTVTLSAPQVVQATATAVLVAGSVSHIIVDNGGNGYTSIPNVTLSGDGTGATATAIISRQQSHRAELAQSATSILQWDNSTTDGQTKLEYTDANSGDVYLRSGTLAGRTFLYLTGQRTRQTYGRASPQPYKMQVSTLVLNSRTFGMANTVPPTSGEFARGDVVFAINPVAGGSPGVVCTTSGVAGSTAVFKAMAALAA